MYLRHLSLTHFRNYTNLEVDFAGRAHVLRGDNAQGKTNLLESVYVLATMRSPLAARDRELVGWSAEQEVIPHTDLEATFLRGGDEHRVSITMVVEPTGGPGGQSVFRRRVRLDGVPCRAMDAVGYLKASLFLPEDINLVAGPPSGRRRYLDVTMCQVDQEYCRALARYNRVVSQRNALLRQVREGSAARSNLGTWDTELVRLGSYVLERRLRAVAELGEEAAKAHDALSDGKEALSFLYHSTVDEYACKPGPPKAAEEMGERFARALKRAYREEIARGVTIVGPHRDDLRLIINGRDATIYGSRGQQRTAALALKLGEMAFIEATTGEAPILLLDDVLSELDQRRRQRVLAAVSSAEQVLLTTSDLDNVDPGFLNAATLWEVASASLRLVRGPVAA